MTTTSSRTLRRAAIAGGAACIAVAMGGIAPALAAPAHHPAATPKDAPVTAGSRYLALGDSVAFGYRESNSTDPENFNKPKKIDGFAEDVATGLGLKLSNASCPGETTASFIDATAQSNGCENLPPSSPGGSPNAGGYRTMFPLHVAYKNAKQSQLAYASTYLKKHPNTKLVTLMIGANDGFLCIEQTSDSCASELTTVQATVEKNLKTVFKTFRKTDGYKGQIVLVNYYSTDYTNGFASFESQQLDQALLDAAQPYDVSIADGYGTFETAAAQQGGDTCAAQLVTSLTGDDAGTCGVHPSVAGQALLAQAVEQAIKK